MIGIKTSHIVEAEKVYWRYDPDDKLLSGGLCSGVYTGKDALDWLDVDIARLTRTLNGLRYLKGMMEGNR